MGCTHQKTEPIARRGGIDYVRCKDCGQVFEADDLDSAPFRRAHGRELKEERESLRH